MCRVPARGSGKLPEIAARFFGRAAGAEPRPKHPSEAGPLGSRLATGFSGPMRSRSRRRTQDTRGSVTLQPPWVMRKDALCRNFPAGEYEEYAGNQSLPELISAEPSNVHQTKRDAENEQNIRSR